MLPYNMSCKVTYFSVEGEHHGTWGDEVWLTMAGNGPCDLAMLDCCILGVLKNQGAYEKYSEGVNPRKSWCNVRE